MNITTARKLGLRYGIIVPLGVIFMVPLVYLLTSDLTLKETYKDFFEYLESGESFGPWD
jgi:hypothetical protein